MSTLKYFQQKVLAFLEKKMKKKIKKLQDENAEFLCLRIKI